MHLRVDVFNRVLAGALTVSGVATGALIGVFAAIPGIIAGASFGGAVGVLAAVVVVRERAHADRLDDAFDELVDVEAGSLGPMEAEASAEAREAEIIEQRLRPVAVELYELPADDAEPDTVRSR